LSEFVNDLLIKFIGIDKAWNYFRKIEKEIFHPPYEKKYTAIPFYFLPSGFVVL